MSLAELAGVAPDIEEVERALIVKGRYKLPDPETGKAKTWTRVTNHVRAVEDSFGLDRWMQRMVATGLVARPDLYALAASQLDDRAALDDTCGAAREAAKSSAGANHGTALHRFTELVDLGEPVPAGPWDDDLDAYRCALNDAGVMPLVDWLERIVVVPEIGVAGRFDKLVRLEGFDAPMVADVKTGQIKGDDPAKAAGEWAVQLACYSRATHAWVPERGEYEPMPPVDTERGLVIWLPAGTGTCHLLLVDLTAGWEGAQLAASVRGFQRRTSGLATMLGTADLCAVDAAPLVDDPHPEHAETPPDDPPAAPERIAWVLGRVEAVKAHSDDAAALLGRLWAEQLADVPTPKAVREGATWGDLQASRIIAALAFVEAEHAIPFGPSDPTPTDAPTAPSVEAPALPVPGDDGAPVDEVAVRRTVADVPEAIQAVVSAWAGDAKRAGRPFTPRPLLERHVAVLNAAIAAATHLHDVELDPPDLLVVGALDEVLGAPLAAHHSTGACLGALTIGQANALAELAASVATPDTKETRNP